jgi:hypothetical protein
LTSDETTTQVVARARARLARAAARRFRAGQAIWAFAGGGLAAALRPLLWKLGASTPLWVGVTRAAGLFTAGFALTWLVLGWIGKRRAPSEVAAARALDEALGLHEVVASGFAFARDARESPLETLAIRRADDAARPADVRALFPLPRWSPRRSTWTRGALVAFVALGVGAYDRALALALLSPPSSTEVGAARELDAAAADLAKELAAHNDFADPKRGPLGRDRDGGERDRRTTLVEKAREAAGAAQKGDRSRALEKLQDLRAAGAKQASHADDVGAALEKMRDALERPAAGKTGSPSGEPLKPSANAAESMRLLAKKMRDEQEQNGAASKESTERMLERLSRAGDEARKSAQDRGSDSEAARAAKALSQAAEAMQRGDREAAAKMLDEAASRADAMEKERAELAAEADAIAEMLEKSGALEQAIQLAMLGREGSNGEGKEGEGSGRSQDGEGKSGQGKPGRGALRAAVLARLAALGVTRQDSAPGTKDDGQHLPDRKRAKRDQLAVEGSMRAPSQVGEGERAIQAIKGLGRGSEPPASYREVFPAYDAAAEEGIADERVPARRRAAVRRYFQAIRPDQPDTSERHP